jgi:hypothetical protein
VSVEIGPLRCSHGLAQLLKLLKLALQIVSDDVERAQRVACIEKYASYRRVPNLRFRREDDRLKLGASLPTGNERQTTSSGPSWSVRFFSHAAYDGTPMNAS